MIQTKRISNWALFETMVTRDAPDVYYFTESGWFPPPESPPPEFNSNGYHIFAWNGVALFEIKLRDPLQAERDEFELAYKDDATVLLDPDDVFACIPSSFGGNRIQQVELAPRRGRAGQMGYTIAGPDFTRKDSWYQHHLQHVAHVLTDSGDLTTFTSSNPDWINIDSWHASIQNYNAGPSFGYAVVGPWLRSGGFGLKDQFRPMVEADVGAGWVDRTHDGTYTIDYLAGTVTFSSPLPAGSQVRVTYRTALSSEMVLRPPVGKFWTISHAEVNVGVDITLNDGLMMEVWANGDDFTDLTKRNYEMPYESFRQVLALSTRGADRYPAMGGSNPVPASKQTGWATDCVRGTSSDWMQIPFEMGAPSEFGKPIELDGNKGEVLRVFLADNQAHTGDGMTVTFYIDELCL